jgi:hypothetical protein
MPFWTQSQHGAGSILDQGEIVCFSEISRKGGGGVDSKTINAAHRACGKFRVLHPDLHRIATIKLVNNFADLAGRFILRVLDVCRWKINPSERLTLTILPQQRISTEQWSRM